MKKISIALLCLVLNCTVFAADHYWIGGTVSATADFRAKSNWSLTLGGTAETGTGNITLAATETLIIDGSNLGSGVTSGTVTLNSTGSYTIGRLLIKNGANVVMQRASSNGSLTINGDGTAADDFIIDSTATYGASKFSLRTPGSGIVGGMRILLGLSGAVATGTVTGTFAQLDATTFNYIAVYNTGALVFSGSGTCVVNNAATQYPFSSGNSSSFATDKSVVFQSGSRLYYISGGSPFSNGSACTNGCGLTSIFPADFQAGSTVYYLASNTGSSGRFSDGRSYSNLSVAAGVTLTCDATSTYGSLTVTDELSNAGTVDLHGSSAVLNGTVTGTGVISGAANSSLTIDGSGSLGTLNFSQSADTTNLLKNFTLNRTSGSAVLGSKVIVLNTVNLNNGTLNTGGNLTLRSLATGTASLAAVTGTGAITGNVTVERFIPSGGRKSYTMVTSPVTGPSINAAWQEGGATIANYGTQITGAAAGNGFDAASASGFASIFTYNDGNLVGSKWVGLTNTNATNLAAGKGYLLYVRGDRAEARHTTGNSSNTTLRATGTITTGDFTPVLTTTDSAFNLVANPYPCAITWSALTKSNLANSFYVYDPNLAVFVTSNGTTVSPNTSQQQANVIQSGQAFFIQKSSGVPSITFTEASKTTAATTTSATTVFGNEAPAAQLNINIYNKSNNELADGVVALFGNSYKAGIAKEDAAKMDNFNETFSLTRNNNRLSIEGRPMVKGNDTLFFAMNNFSKKEYVLKVYGSNFSEANATLVDNYTGTKTALDLAGISTYNFTVNGDAASTSNDRFMITFGSTATIAAGETTDNYNSMFVKVGPNPVSNQLQVNFKTATAENTVIKIINSLGQTVKTVNAGKVNAGNISIPTGSLAGGLYTVQLMSGDKKIASQKVVKL